MIARTPPTENSSGEILPRCLALRQLSRLVFRGALLAASVFATICAIALAVPDNSDYALSSVLKHQRLAEVASRKIVLVGGSNLSFGVDSATIQKATSCPVINMGMNGYFGAHFILEEIKPTLNPADIVVVSFEWDAFYKPIDGIPVDLFGVVKANPETYRFLTLEQKLRVLAALPSIAQQKTIRLISDSIVREIKRWVEPNFELEPESQRLYWNVILRLASNSPEGDLVSHLDVDWPYPRLKGNIMKDAAINPDILRLIADFSAEMAKRGVIVVISYTPVMKSFHALFQDDWDAVHKTLAATPTLVTPSPPSEFVYDEKYFFDTVYHLNGAGRALRTQKMIQDLHTQLHEQVQCS